MRRRTPLNRATEKSRAFRESRSELKRTPMRRAPGLSRRGFGTRGDKPRLTRSQPYREPWQENPKPGPCRNCGSPHVEMHHAVPRSLSRKGRDDPRNWLPLCRTCHNAWHAGYPLPRSVFTPEEFAFVAECAPSIGWMGRKYPFTVERPALESEAA